MAERSYEAGGFMHSEVGAWPVAPRRFTVYDQCTTCCGPFNMAVGVFVGPSGFYCSTACLPAVKEGNEHAQ